MARLQSTILMYPMEYPFASGAFQRAPKPSNRLKFNGYD